MGSSGQDSVGTGTFCGGYILGNFCFFFNILDLDFLHSTNAMGASEKSQYIYSEGILFFHKQKTSVNRNRDSAHIDIGGLGSR